MVLELLLLLLGSLEGSSGTKLLLLEELLEFKLLEELDEDIKNPGQVFFRPCQSL